jgi:KR domain/Zinc-binding dehydrogenase
VLRATNGKGVDVVLNSLTGDLLHAGWRCCASFGRFVEIGKLDLTGGGKLEMDQFLKNVTFTAFDMSNLYNTDNPAHHALWARLLADVLQFYREKKIVKIEPLKVFDVSEATQALRYFSSRNRMGKVAINLENDKSVLRVQPPRYNSTFSPNKSYVMIGCLGGLGRSLAKWMITRGARKFVFLGRSGLDKAPARRLVENLEQNGADCRVVRGDVCSQSDIQAVMDQVDGLVGGVIQAAMGLNVSNKHALLLRLANFTLGGLVHHDAQRILAHGHRSQGHGDLEPP